MFTKNNSSLFWHLGCRTDGSCSFFPMFFSSVLLPTKWPVLKTTAVLQKLQTDRERVFYFSQGAKIYNISSGSVSASQNKRLIPFLVWCFWWKPLNFSSFPSHLAGLSERLQCCRHKRLYLKVEKHTEVFPSLSSYLSPDVHSPSTFFIPYSFSIYCRLFFQLGCINTSEDQQWKMQPASAILPLTKHCTTHHVCLIQYTLSVQCACTTVRTQTQCLCTAALKSGLWSTSDR